MEKNINFIIFLSNRPLGIQRFLFRDLCYIFELSVEASSKPLIRGDDVTTIIHSLLDVLLP